MPGAVTDRDGVQRPRTYVWASAALLSTVAFVSQDVSEIKSLHPCGGALNCIQAMRDLHINLKIVGVWDTDDRLAGTILFYQSMRHTFLIEFGLRPLV